MTSDSKFLQKWLKGARTPSPRYHHVKYVEIDGARADIIAELRSHVNAAHGDAIKHVIELIGDNALEPTSLKARSLKSVYPSGCHDSVLKGYFGEFMAGFVAEQGTPLGTEGWQVPAYLFRFHDLQFQHLDQWLQTGATATPLPGRSGDDCLAFKIGEHDRIVAVLVCESKCTSSHRSEAIVDAHKSVSRLNEQPTSIMQLIEVLQDKHDDAGAKDWVERLRRLLLGARFERCDCVFYICGEFPKKKAAWMDPMRPHKDYSGGRRLEATEVHLADLDALIDLVYR
jgi:hypothetical protein